MKQIVLFILIAFFIIGCDENKVEEEKSIIKNVFAVYPVTKDKNAKRVLNGTATSKNERKLSFKVQGNVEYLRVEIGDEVKKGQLIAKIDSKPYELKYSQVKYALSEANAALSNAKSSYERVKKLYVNQNSSISDLDKARSAYNAYKAKVKNVRKEMEFVKLKLSYTKLYSPITGFISSKFIQENENVGIGTPIVIISDKKIDEVELQVPENLINKIEKKEKVKVKFPSLDNSTYEAYVKDISKSTSLRTKTYKVVLKIKESSSLIKSGMSADVYFDFPLKSSTTAYLIPVNSVLKDDNGHFIYLLKKLNNNYKIIKKYVKVGKLSAKGYEVLDGISLKDLVLKAGMSEVYENMEVELGNKKDLGL